MAIPGAHTHRCMWKRDRCCGSLDPCDNVEWLDQASPKTYTTIGLFHTRPNKSFFKLVLLDFLEFGVCFVLYNQKEHLCDRPSHPLLT